MYSTLFVIGAFISGMIVSMVIMVTFVIHSMWILAQTENDRRLTK